MGDYMVKPVITLPLLTVVPGTLTLSTGKPTPRYHRYGSKGLPVVIALAAQYQEQSKRVNYPMLL